MIHVIYTEIYYVLYLFKNSDLYMRSALYAVVPVVYVLIDIFITVYICMQNV